MINEHFQPIDNEYTADNAEADRQENDSEIGSFASDMSFGSATDIDDLAISLSSIVIENQRQLAVARSWIAGQQRLLNSEVPPSVILNETFFNAWGENVVTALANLPDAAHAIPLIAEFLEFRNSNYTPEVTARFHIGSGTRYFITSTKALKAMLHDIPGVLIPLLSSTNNKYSVQEGSNICDTAVVKMLVAKPGQKISVRTNRENSYPTINSSMTIGERTVTFAVDIHVLVKLCQMLVKVLTPPHVVNGDETKWFQAVLFGTVRGDEVRAFLGDESPLSAGELPVISHDSHDTLNLAQLSIVTNGNNRVRSNQDCVGWLFCPACRHTMDAGCTHTPRCTYVKIGRCLGCASV